MRQRPHLTDGKATAKAREAGGACRHAGVRQTSGAHESRMESGTGSNLRTGSEPDRTSAVSTGYSTRACAEQHQAGHLPCFCCEAGSRGIDTHPVRHVRKWHQTQNETPHLFRAFLIEMGQLLVTAAATEETTKTAWADRTGG